MKEKLKDQPALDQAQPCGCSGLLGARLRQWRIERNLPLKHLASDLGVSSAIVSAWENGKRFPSVRHLDQLATYLSMPPCLLICPDHSQCPLDNENNVREVTNS